MGKPLILNNGQVAELPDDQNLDASNIQLRGEALGYVITRDPAGSATAGLERYRTYSDGTVDLVRRDTDGLVLFRFRGCNAHIVSRDADGLETRETFIPGLELQECVYSNNGTRLIPSNMNDDNENLSMGEFIIAYLQAGFTENRQPDSTHQFSYSIRSLDLCFEVYIRDNLLSPIPA